ncbi:MAG TPA: amidohydrolase family protein [Vicinamibacterales bacterium]|nr:amidohydrolase family protein [Vicinamibacterales bacterium]
MLYRARWVLPISSPPIRDAWVLVESGRVAAVGAASTPSGHQPIELGSVAVLPGLVNAHTHLELSWMRGRIAPARRMADWIRAVMMLRREVHRDDPLAMASAAAEMRRAGTSLVGDITNTLGSVPALAAGPIGGCVFYEILGFNHPQPRERVADAAAMVRDVNARMAVRADGRRPQLRASVVPHAPYSVSPALFREIAAAAHDERWITSVHVGESADEVEFLREGSGPWRDLLEQLGVWPDDWRAPGTGPVAYLESFGAITGRTLVVHAVRLTDAELRRVAEIGATIVTCPRSNEWVGAGTPPVARFYASGARVAIGTDSLASCPDLNLFAELARVRRLTPEVGASRILDSATRAGAEALGFAGEHGTIQPGRRADLIAVDVPDGTTDVEEYLCSGVSPERVRWLNWGQV